MCFAGLFICVYTDAKLCEIKCSLTTVSATDEQSYMSMCDFGGAKVSSCNKETGNSVSQTLKPRSDPGQSWGIYGETNKSHEGEERKSKLVHCLVI